VEAREACHWSHTLLASSEQACEPISSSSVNSYRKTRTAQPRILRIWWLERRLLRTRPATGLQILPAMHLHMQTNRGTPWYSRTACCSFRVRVRVRVRVLGLGLGLGLGLVLGFGLRFGLGLGHTVVFSSCLLFLQGCKQCK
jgi:hypothetical protein